MEGIPMSVKVFCTAFLLTLLISLLQANMDLPRPVIDYPVDYADKIIEIRGFANYPETVFYLVNATDGLVLEKAITTDTLRIITSGQKNYFISIDSTLAAWQPGKKYGADTPEHEMFIKNASQFLQGAFPDTHFIKQKSCLITFFPDWGHKTKGTKLKTVSFTIVRHPGNVLYTQSGAPIHIPDKGISLEPDKRNNPGSQYYDDQGNLNLRGYIWQTFNPEYYKRQFQYFILKFDKPNKYQHFTPERRAIEQRQKWHRLYNKTLGYGYNYHLLHESYEHVEQVMQENRKFYSAFFLFAAFLTILIELAVLFLLFNPVTGFPLKENAGMLVLACVLGTGFTITMLWWVFPSLLHSYAKITMGGEIFALVVESFVYYYLISKIRYFQAFILSVFCNLTSYLFGLWLYRMIFLFI